MPSASSKPSAAPVKSHTNGEFRFIDSSSISQGPFSNKNQKMHARKRAVKAKASST